MEFRIQGKEHVSHPGPKGGCPGCFGAWDTLVPGFHQTDHKTAVCDGYGAGSNMADFAIRALDPVPCKHARHMCARVPNPKRKMIDRGWRCGRPLGNNLSLPVSISSW